MTPNTDLARAHGATPELPAIDYAFLAEHLGPETANLLCITRWYDGIDIEEPCIGTVRLLQAYARAAIQQAAVAVPEGGFTAFCSSCGELKPATFRQCEEHGTGRQFEDLCCDECNLVIATLSGHTHAPEVNRDQVHSDSGGSRGVSQPLTDEPWDFWDSVGIVCGGYGAASDTDLIGVFIESNTDERWFSDIAESLNLDPSYVQLLQEILCSANFCEYGTSPRGAWAIGDKYEANLQKLKAWYLKKWEHEFTHAPRPNASTSQINPGSAPREGGNGS